MGTRLPGATLWLSLRPGGLALWEPFLEEARQPWAARAKETLTPGAVPWASPDLCLLLQGNPWPRGGFCPDSLVRDGRVTRALDFSLSLPRTRRRGRPSRAHRPSFCLCGGVGGDAHQRMWLPGSPARWAPGTVGCLSGWRQAWGASPRRKTSDVREEETPPVCLPALWGPARSPPDWVLEAGGPRPPCWRSHCLRRPLPGHRSSPLSSLAEGTGSSQDPLREAPPSCPAHLLTPSPWGVGFNRWVLWGTQSFRASSSKG